jgi:hypothetical protein
VELKATRIKYEEETKVWCIPPVRKTYMHPTSQKSKARWYLPIKNSAEELKGN